MWGQSHGYCADCRALHRERKDEPLCEKTNGAKCEVIQSYQTSDGEKEIRPFKLLPENHLPMELYHRTIALSDLTEYSGKKKTGMYPSLSALPFILDNLIEGYGIDQMDFLLEKIQMIHQMKLDYFLNKLQ